MWFNVKNKSSKDISHTYGIFSPHPNSNPKAIIKQTCWNVNSTWLFVHRTGRVSTEGYCAAQQWDPVEQLHFWEFFRRSKLHVLGQSSVSWWSFTEGLVIPPVINLCFELKNDVKAEGTSLLLYATCQMFQHILYIDHKMVTTEPILSVTFCSVCDWNISI